MIFKPFSGRLCRRPQREADDHAGSEKHWNPTLGLAVRMRETWRVGEAPT